MAENNIKVNWIVNTADVERAKQILQQADQVGNKFQQTAQNTGKAVAQGYNTANQSLLQMRQQLERLQFRIENTAQSDKKRLSELSAQYKTLDQQIQKATKSLYEQEKAIKANATAAQQTTASFGQLYNAVRLFLSAGLVKESVNLILSMATLSGNIQGVSRAFERTIPNGTRLLNDLRSATQGTISDFELMKQALQAKNFGLPVQNLAKLLEFATVKAQQTGLSIDYITNSLVTGLGRKSERVFDNLQLDIAELRKRIASGLDFREAGIQLVIEDLERMGGVIRTSAQDVDELKAKFEELQAVFGKKLTEGGGGGIIGLMTTGVKELTTAIKAVPVDKLKDLMNPFQNPFTNNVFKEVGDFVAFWIDGINKINRENYALELALESVEQVQKKLTGTNDERIKQIQKEIDTRVQLIFTYNLAIANMRDEQDILRAKNPYDERIDNIEKMIVAYHRSGDVVNQVIKLLREEQIALKQALIDPETLGLIEAKIKQIEETSDNIKTAKSVSEIHRLNNELAILQGELSDLKAFGTTKQFLEVNGQIKLVPIEDYKIKQYKVQTENALGELEVKTKLVLGQSQAGTEQLEKDVQEMINNMRFTIPPPAPSSNGITPMSEWEKIGQEFADNWRSILSQGIDDTTMIIDASIQKEADAYAARINQARMYYDELMILAGDNEKQKDRLRLREMREMARLRKEAFEADKRAKISQTVISGAAAIVKTFAELGYPAGIPAALLMAATTAAQIAVINAEQPRFAKGVIDLKGPGSKTSDSIPARLSKGESVMTADETGASMGILKDIRAGKLNDKLLARKLDSGILKDLKLSKNGVTYAPPMNDERIVNKIDQLIHSQPDYERINGELYKTRKKSENYKQWVRAKIM